MKKLLFVISLLFIICACTKPESTPTPTPTKQSENIPLQTSLTEPLPVSMTESSCKMGKYDCWDIIQDLKNETESSTTPKRASNPALEKKGLSIIQFFRSSDSQFYILSNHTIIIIYDSKLNEKSGTQGYISIEDTINKKMTIYDSMGNIKNTKNEITESSCKIGEYDCWDIIQDLKNKTEKNPSAERATNSALEKKGLLILRYRKFLDDGSEGYFLSNKMDFHIYYKNSNNTQEYTTILDYNNHDSGKKVTYDNEGNIVSVGDVIFFQ